MTVHALPIGLPVAPVPGLCLHPLRVGERLRKKNRSGERAMELTARRRTIALALGCLALVLGGAAQAADEYPTKPVRVFVPYGPGGVGDLTVRILTQALGESLKQRFIIENRAGAGGAIAMKGVLDAPADGYTLGEMGNGQAIATTLFANLPYDVLKDFSPVSVAGAFPVLIAVAGGSPYRTLADVVEAAQKNPGKLNLGAINPGSTQNLSAHLFRQITGVDVTVIPYRTTPDLVTALLRRDVDVGFDYYAGFQANLGEG